VAEKLFLRGPFEIGAIAPALWHNLTGVLPMETTRLSTKGQIILPKGIRDSRAWGPGTEFEIEETGDGILLRPAARFPDTNLEEVAGSLRSSRKSTTPAQMSAAIVREVRRRHDRGRY
jgi:AbrB family looped-hinge helix DNA binding protein